MAIEIGYHLSSEEHPAQDLVGYARRAEEVGFDFATISDHFHPWTDHQGHAPFVWGVLGAIAQVTERLRIGTGVTCPIFRTHPLQVAHAAATAATMMPGRFFLGIGTGERLNEHVLGQHWPPSKVRLEMLEEAISIFRLFWESKLKTHEGKHFTVESARIYDIPQSPVPIIVSAGGSNTATMAGKKADGLIALVPNDKLVNTFEEAGGKAKPKLAKITVCWDEDEAVAKKTALRQWPIDALPGRILPELRLPKDFEAAAELLDEEDIAAAIICGPDAAKHLAHIDKFADAGYDHVYVHQIGANQEGFFQFYESEVIPKVKEKS